MEPHVLAPLELSRLIHDLRHALLEFALRLNACVLSACQARSTDCVLQAQQPHRQGFPAPASSWISRSRLEMRFISASRADEHLDFADPRLYIPIAPHSRAKHCHFGLRA